MCNIASCGLYHPIYPDAQWVNQDTVQLYPDNQRSCEDRVESIVILFFIILIRDLLLHVDSTIQFILILNELLRIQYNFILTLKGAVRIELILFLFYFFHSYSRFIASCGLNHPIYPDTQWVTQDTVQLYPDTQRSCDDMSWIYYYFVFYHSYNRFIASCGFNLPIYPDTQWVTQDTVQLYPDTQKDLWGLSWFYCCFFLSFL